MAKDLESTMKFKLDIKEFKANIQDAKRQISLANAEFKKNTSGAKDWASSITGVEGKIRQLKTTLNSQTTILSQLKKEYDAVAKEMGEDSAEAQKLKVQITNQEAAINKTASQLSQYNGKLCELKAEEKESSSALSRLNSTIDSQKSKLESLKKEYQNAVLTYGKNSKEAKSLAREISNLSGELAKNENKLSETEKSADKLDKSLDDTEKSAKNAANGGFTVLNGALANLAASGIQSAIGGLKKLGSEIISLGKQAINNYAAYEQLIGGVETLFKSSAGFVENYANNAFKTAGLTANEYMETVTSFSAGLIASLGGDTEKAAQIGDMAITDMSDNANKMGTDMQLIQNAYQGFAKQNYTMLDNLKLGYGGTKSEMERLLADAEKISGIKYDISNLKDVYEAIHVVQTELGITGTTAKEAGETIEGSTAAMKASWQNLLTGIAKGGDLSELVENFVQSVMTLGKNLIPTIQNVVKGMGQIASGLLSELIPKLLEEIPPLINESLPMLVDSAQTAIQAVLEVLPSVIDGITDVIPQIISALFDMMPQLINVGIQAITSLIQGVADALPALLSQIPDIVTKIIAVIAENLPAFIDACINFFMGIIEAIPEIINALVQDMPKIIQTIIKALIEGIPQLIDGAIKLFMALIEAIPVIIQELVANLPKIISTIVKTLIENLPLLIKASVELFMALIKAIPTIIAELGRNIPQIISAIVQGLSAGIGEIAEVGLNLVRGLWNGIQDAAGWVLEKIKGFGETILNGIKDFFGIHSPSKTMRDQVGKQLALGISDGFEENMGTASRQIKSSLNAALKTVKADIPVLAGKLDISPRSRAFTVNAAGGETSRVVNFYQTINSPKAVDRLTLYRETNSLLFGAKTRLRNI